MEGLNRVRIGIYLSLMAMIILAFTPSPGFADQIEKGGSRQLDSNLFRIASTKPYSEFDKDIQERLASFDYRGAMKTAQKALEFAKQKDDKGAIGAFLFKIGGCYMHLGYLSKAVTYYEQAINIFREIKDTQSEALVLFVLGGTQVGLGNYAEALSYFKQVAELKPSGVYEKLVDLAIGDIYLEQGNFEQALQIFKKHSSDIHTGRYYLKKGEYHEAKKNFEKILKVYLNMVQKVKTFPPYFGVISYIGLGLSHEGLNEYSQAKDCFQKAIEIIKKIRQAMEQRENLFSEAGVGGGTYSPYEPYEGMIRVLFKEKAEGYASKALFYAERVKSRSFLDMLSQENKKGKTAEDQAVMEKDRNYQKRILELRNKGAGKEIEKLQGEYEAFIKEVKLQYSELASLISVNPAQVKEVQSELDKDVTLLEYYTTGNRTYAWVLTREDIKVYEIPLTEKDLKEKVDSFLLPNISNLPRKTEPVIIFSTGDEDKKETTEKEREENRERFYHLASDLYNSIMTPFEKDIRTDKLIIVPHGVLHRVPFSTLTDGKRFLVDKYAISVLPAASVAEFIVKKRKPNKEKLLALANPQTDYVPLGFAEVEGKVLSTLFPQNEVYFRERATETIVKKRASDFNIIHFASHGEFNDRQPLQSGLLLAKDSENDGYLQVHEIFGMDLRNANLVTLSACETALSKITGGDDLVGLSRGFIYAGTPSLLATLWKVDDKSTSILMEQFYKNWQKGMSKPEALRQAQITLKAMPQYRHPFYWAPFVMIGDWK